MSASCSEKKRVRPQLPYRGMQVPDGRREIPYRCDKAVPKGIGRGRLPLDIRGTGNLRLNFVGFGSQRKKRPFHPLRAGNS
ncbi:hypothetical protein LJ756_07000 [Arthrobacter sp. zg-Y411]|uniref:hypothetical protein n=1 Tax=Arthrobacter zhangbolii TaxID=2886936 RepID=UPI001D15B92B|nr:hypothetical protein [Arthrobacter zhangbolii]MCC3294370.1 hypothetical protein [Arthrobacter zhangbolii]